MKQDELADVLSEFAQTMVTDFPIQGILDHLVKRIVDVMPITAAGVTLISPGLDPRYVAASDGSALLFEKLQTELGEGPCLEAYETGEAVLVPDLNTERRFPHFSPRALDAGLTAVFTFPMRHADVLLGALDLYRETAGVLTPGSMRAAQTLADVAAAYLINAQARADLQDSSDESRDAAMHDPLTGLPNRILLMQRLEHAFLRAQRSGKTTAVLFVDLDEFKAVNDTYGHRVGDELLVAVAERLVGVLRPGDSLARLSGDEFVVICEDLDHPAQADAIAARFDAALGLPFVLSRDMLHMQASIGIAFTGVGSGAPEEIIQDADHAMYLAKRHKGGRHQISDLRELNLEEHHASLARGLPGAAERGELQVVYQPIVDTVDGRMTGVEALARWTHPSRGSVSPTVFIPLAEHSGQIIDLGRWVLEQAWRDRQHWQRDRTEELAMSVNVSAHQFMAVGFAGSVASVLDSAGTDPGLLTLEVNESIFIRDVERALVVLEELRTIGVKLALDDFGTGYSSLSYLSTLPIDAIKVDPVFIANLDRDPLGHPILAAIIQLAHGLGITVVSEGVETLEQQEELIRLGSDCAQGFYFAHPMPALTLDALIQCSLDGGSPRLPISAQRVGRVAGPVPPARAKTA
jgi:diguanylate cyclase (GGDEF)-like protein